MSVQHSDEYDDAEKSGLRNGPGSDMQKMQIGGGANKNATARDTKIAICSVVVTLVAVIAIIAGGARTEAGKKILKDAARDPVPDYERYQSMFTDHSWEGAMQPEVKSPPSRACPNPMSESPPLTRRVWASSDRPMLLFNNDIRISARTWTT